MSKGLLVGLHTKIQGLGKFDNTKILPASKTLGLGILL